MDRRFLVMLFFPISILSACASIDFDYQGKSDETDDGLLYYEGTPYVLLQSTKDCTYNTQVLMVPTVKKHLKLKSGAIGSSNLSITLSQGMIASVGQTTDTKVPEMVAALTGAYSASKKTQGVGDNG
ncbi:hypothetical protein PS900_03619 [Pseudomonas fluorescens]|uniref:Lipoprotein n=1 Tax=Pseudomonas fluorescens TaxID=294 RepID=A0A8H2RTF8_PSEFL|nr:hypothetical protein [Pseudomonas fluorescens]VVP16446.1 hypothetical protein PS900_03619 [Pseudomonas fluorescens]